MLAAYGFMLLVGASFALLLLMEASKPEGTAYLRRLGRRIPLPWEEARIYFAIVGLGLLGLILRSFFVAARATFEIPAVAAKRIDLALGESVKWKGRLGRRSFGRERAVVAGLMALGTLPLVLAFSWVLLSEGHRAGGWGAQIAFSGVFLLILGPMAFGPLLSLTFRDNRWFHELTGYVAITDRRILWCRFDGRVAHELLPDRLLDAALIEEAGNCGWISLGLRKGRLNRESYELRGVPEPHAALARLQQLIPRAEAEQR